jgi:3-oxoacyl-[acyl-carrier-protein] synthase II
MNDEGSAEQPLRKELFSFPFKNFGRLDPVSRMAAYAVALTLRDAGIEYAQDRKLDMGIIGTNAMGSLDADIRYFRDYLETGRTTARGNLFIYTLPSSPLGEAAIHFGLQGPLYYIAGVENPLETILDATVETMLVDDIPAMLAGIFEEDAAVCFALVKHDDSSGQHCLCDSARAAQIAGERRALPEIIREFSRLRERN